MVFCGEVSRGPRLGNNILFSIWNFFWTGCLIIIEHCLPLRDSSCIKFVVMITYMAAPFLAGSEIFDCRYTGKLYNCYFYFILLL